MNAHWTYGRDRYVLSSTGKGQECMTRSHSWTDVWVLCGTGNLSLWTAVQGAYSHSWRLVADSRTVRVSEREERWTDFGAVHTDCSLFSCMLHSFTGTRALFSHGHACSISILMRWRKKSHRDFAKSARSVWIHSWRSPLEETRAWIHTAFTRMCLAFL